jgi:hypothetical protein
MREFAECKAVLVLVGSTPFQPKETPAFKSFLRQVRQLQLSPVV